MRKVPKGFVCLLIGISIVDVSVSTAQAQNKPDSKVMKDCEAVNETFDNASFSLYLIAPLSKNRDLARVEIGEKQLTPAQVLIDCGKIDMKTWKDMKQDYISAIKNANTGLKRIVAKYKLLPIVTLTCEKKGKITKVESTNPKCPKGYKELYKE
jgi:hypothetical protein